MWHDSWQLSDQSRPTGQTAQLLLPVAQPKVPHHTHTAAPTPASPYHSRLPVRGSAQRSPLPRGMGHPQGLPPSCNLCWVYLLTPLNAPTLPGSPPPPPIQLPQLANTPPPPPGCSLPPGLLLSTRTWQAVQTQCLTSWFIIFP